MNDKTELLSIKDASKWASDNLKRTVTPANISYLVNYGVLKKYGENGIVFIDKHELVNYYRSFHGKREVEWKDQLGNDLNWALSFDQYTEAERTKHVHRLHPYKGKFIPQLVEYFLDSHVDDFKKEIYFQKGDILLDPFAGSGTTLVQASEMGMHAIGVDISAFNVLISNVKFKKHDLAELHREIKRITISLRQFLENSKTIEFENHLTEELRRFNDKFFPVPEYKYKLKRGEIEEDEFGKKKELEFLPIFKNLVREYAIELLPDKANSFIEKWYLAHVRIEIEFIFKSIKSIPNEDTRNVLMVILSRTMRSCRATTHADLATLIEPVKQTYYCAKHGKICKPLFSVLSWWTRYSGDTVSRLSQFNSLRRDANQYCVVGDSREIDLIQTLQTVDPKFADFVRENKIKGIFSSPPYVGLIDYHEQHAYAYDLFGFERNDDLEIGPLKKGQGRGAKESYIEGIAAVLRNCSRYLAVGYHVFIVANDKDDLYPRISELAGMQIVNQYRRPVLNRTEKDKGAYSESIFHLRGKSN